MNSNAIIAAPNTIYYRLIALWVLCEAMLGGIIHGFKIPVSGLVVGSCAIVCICLIAWYVPGKGAIIKATIVVAIFKMMLSPQAPPPAYIAVFFQGLLGELLFWNRSFFKLSCILLAVLGLLESGLQRILVLTIVGGNDIWKAINDFINGLTRQKQTTNYSLWIGGAYVMLHFIAGLVAGWWASVLPKRIGKWSADKSLYIDMREAATINQDLTRKKRKRLKTGLFIMWLLLIVLYVQSYFKIGEALLPSHVSLKILLRSVIIVLGWIFIIGPLVTELLHGWLKKKQSKSQKEVQEVLNLLPQTRAMVAESWKRSAIHRGLQRMNVFSKMILVNSLHNADTRKEIYILTAPVQSGKTTSLVSWATKRNDVYGILTPVIDGKRMFLDLHSDEQFAMEANGDEETIVVGRFVFSKKGFEKAIRVIQDAAGKSGWLVIDEVGPLEMRGEGFANILKEILTRNHERIILVVREGLARDVQQNFKIEEAKVISNIEEIRER